MKSFFVVFVILGCSIVVRSNECYLCDDNTEQACADPFNPESTKSMATIAMPPHGVCLKIKIESPDGSHVVRSIAPNDSLCPGGSTDCTKVIHGEESVSFCCCSQNLCNRMSTFQQQPLFLLTITFVLFIYRQG